MIKKSEPVSCAEVRDIISKLDEEQRESERAKRVLAYTKKFTSLSSEDAAKLRSELGELGLLKLKAEHIIKLIDIMPRDEEDIRKIFVDISLDQNEISQILETVKKYI